MANQNRFSATNDGTIKSIVEMSTSEFLDLPQTLNHLTQEAVKHKFPDRANDALSSIIDVVSNFFPDEFENRQLHKELAEKERR